MYDILKPSDLENLSKGAPNFIPEGASNGLDPALSTIHYLLGGLAVV